MTLEPFQVALLVAARNLKNIVRIRGNAVTVIALPVLVLVVFAGAFNEVTRAPGFPPVDAVTWTTPFAVAMGALFVGLGSAFNVQRDLAGGFMDRMLLAPGSRGMLVTGEVLGSVGRALLQVAVILAVAVPCGLDLPGGPGALGLLVLAAVGLATWSGLWSLTLMYWMRSAQAIGLVTLGIFATGLMSTGQVPAELQSGWLRAVTGVNPLTPVLGMAREGLSGRIAWDGVAPGIYALLGVSLLLACTAYLGLRRMASSS
ncbi:ABC transporter permease [Actinocorallia sp. B10E7]|uniref:ABC transporter permease n=1 Tax=Actinocorallia sp. B10E7 TaxID=3153558 RepID=UPI00325E286F